MKRGQTILIRQPHDIMHIMFFNPSNTIEVEKKRPLRENDTSKTDCLIPGVRGADGPFNPVVSTMLPSV